MGSVCRQAGRNDDSTDTEAGRLVRFGEYINVSQRYFFSELRKAQTPVGLRAICVKPRQIGLSTALEAWEFYQTATNPNIFTGIVSYRKDSAKHLKTMLPVFYNHLPKTLKPERRNDNREELIFNNRKGTGLNSYMIVYCAESGDLGASFTINHLHATELSRWPKAKETMFTLSQAIPKHPASSYILESTAKGAGAYFHQLWCEAEEAIRLGLQPAFFPIFIPWFIHEEYILPFEADVEKIGFLEHMKNEDKEYMKLYNLTAERMHWRDTVMRNDCRSSPVLFAQEYPANPQEAFAYADESAFDLTALHQQAQAQKKPEYGSLKIGMANIPQNDAEATRFWVGARDSYELMQLPREVIKFVPSSSVSSILAMFYPPEQNASYVAFTDVASGHQNKKNSNISTILLQQFPQSPNFTRVVVDFTGQIPLEMYAYLLVLLCHYYNDAVLGIEINPGGHGGTLKYQVFDILKYTNLYRRFSFSSDRGGYTNEIGWYTGSNTRPIMLDTLERAISNGDILLTSPALIQECQSFVTSEISHRPEPAAGFKGDRVIACAGALMVHQAHPPSAMQVKEGPGRLVVPAGFQHLVPVPDYEMGNPNWEEAYHGY